jgi:hypothetical protein
LLHGRFPLFNSPDIGHSRTPVKQPSQFVQLLRCTHGVNAHTSVILIPDPAAQPDPTGVIPDEPSEPHTLHAP